MAETCFEMSITSADFERLLPAAVGVAYAREADGYSHMEGGRGWRIRMTALPPLAIALLRLERWRVELSFENYGTDEIARFTRRFLLHFQRGGG